VIRRLYVSNYRCLDNFTLDVGGMSSLLLLGKNGAGKSSIGSALQVLQKIGRGVIEAGELVKPSEISAHKPDVPVRFEIDIEINGSLYHYEVAFTQAKLSRKMVVYAEKLMVDNLVIYDREQTYLRTGSQASQADEGDVRITSTLVSLGLFYALDQDSPVQSLKTWLSRMVIIRPIPSLITGDSAGSTLEPDFDLRLFGEWFSGILAAYPHAYETLSSFLRQAMPDFHSVVNETVGANSRELAVRFDDGNGLSRIRFSDLSDGEKCYFIAGLILVANQSYGPLVCFWDEPDNHLSLDMIGQLTLELRRSFLKSGQLFVTSHHPETIRRFSAENTSLVFRRSHNEATQIRLLSDMGSQPDFVNSFIAGDLDFYG